MRVTIRDVLRARPCVEYSLADIVKLWGGKDSLTHREIASLDIPAEDRLWCLIRCCLTNETRRKFVRDCIELISHKFGAPNREKLPVVIVAKWYAEGIVFNEELVDAWIDSLPHIRNAVRDSVWLVKDCTKWACIWASNIHLHVLDSAEKNAIKMVQLRTAISYIEATEAL